MEFFGLAFQGGVTMKGERLGERRGRGVTACEDGHMPTLKFTEDRNTAMLRRGTLPTFLFGHSLTERRTPGGSNAAEIWHCSFCSFCRFCGCSILVWESLPQPPATGEERAIDNRLKALQRSHGSRQGKKSLC